MASKVWTGGGTTSNPKSGSWQTKTNWSPTGVPASTDDVTIAGSGGYTVSLSANATVNTLTIVNSGAVLTIGSQTLHVDGSTASAINLQAGQITISGGTINDAGGIALASGASLSGAGTLKVSGNYAGTGSLQASGGTLDVFGTISSGVVLQIAPASASTLKIEGTGTAASAIAISSGNQTLEIGPSGNLTINAAENVNNGTILLAGGLSDWPRWSKCWPMVRRPRSSPASITANCDRVPGSIVKRRHAGPHGDG
jgi:large repetitive protein